MSYRVKETNYKTLKKNSFSFDISDVVHPGRSTSQFVSQGQLGWFIAAVPPPWFPNPHPPRSCPDSHVPSPSSARFLGGQLLSSIQQLSKATITAIQRGNVHRVFPRIKPNDILSLIDSRSHHPMNWLLCPRKCIWQAMDPVQDRAYQIRACIR